MAEPLRKKNRIYTYADYASWPDDERWEIIEGQAYSMSPGAKASHQNVSRVIFTELSVYLYGKKCQVYHPPFDVVLLEEGETIDNASNIVQPDILVVCDTKKIYEDKCCLGAPDLIIEIISKSSLSRDMKYKFKLYQRFGVKEYWIVDPLHKAIQVYKLGEDKLYGRAETYLFEDEDKIKVGIFPDLEIDLKLVFELLP